MRLARRSLTGWLALLVTATVSVSVDYLPHTDDGCGVEVHCLACRTTVGQTAATATTVVLQVPGDFVEWLVLLPTPVPRTRDTQPSDSRGPPLA